MRLGTCLVLELVVGIATAAGLGISGAWGVEELRGRLSSGRAAAPSTDRAALVTSLDRPADLAPSPRTLPLFDGLDDQLLVAPLRAAALRRVRFNRGGSSISLRLDFVNGACAAFKPEQTNEQTVPRREVAAYRINRLLGLGSVAPAFGRRFSLDEILAALDPDQRGLAPRLRAEIVADDASQVVGEVSWWIPEIERADIEGFPIDSTDGIVTWKRYLTAGNPIPDESLRLVAQISNMVLFDHLINNSDRWTGGNARVSTDGRFLYYMDNTLSFGISDQGHERTRIYLHRSEKFSRHVVHALRRLTAEEVRAALRDPEPFAYLLDEAEIASLLRRRDYAMAYIDELIALHGESAVLVFP
jgi:hypothetical protein